MIKILSVDDSKMVHMVIARALKPYDVQHLTALNGQDSLEIAEREMPSLIFMDVTMPVMTGMEALGKLKQNPVTAPIPVVMLTAEGGADSMDQAFSLGVSKYLTKPFTEDVLIACLSGFVNLAPRTS